MTASSTRVKLCSVNRLTALAKLPDVYATALRLRDDGADDARVAAALGVDVSAVANVMRLAEAKLNRLLHDEVGGGDPTGE